MHYKISRTTVVKLIKKYKETKENEEKKTLSEYQKMKIVNTKEKEKQMELEDEGMKKVEELSKLFIKKKKN